jgi:DeoR family transcriptional regulator, aga operon transcriptional repressor
MGPPSPISRAHRLLAEERRRLILEQLDQHGRVTVDELARHFGVSAVTIHSDLDALAGLGVLTRSHGGAVQKTDLSQEFPLAYRETLHHAEKVRIGCAAARLIEPHQTIILDNGTTTAEIAREIKRLKLPQLTIITNALYIAAELADLPFLSLIVIGGLHRQISHSFVGPHAEAMLRELHADHLFLAVDGFDLEIGPSTPDVLEAQLNSLMMKAARQVTIVADSSKFGRRSLSVIGPLQGVHRVITDRGVPPHIVEELETHGIQVVVV